MSTELLSVICFFLLFFIEEREADPFFESFNGNSVNCLNDRGRLVDYGDNMRCLDDNVSINYIIYLNLRVLTTTVSHDFESYNERLFKFITLWAYHEMVFYRVVIVGGR